MRDPLLAVRKEKNFLMYKEQCKRSNSRSTTFPNILATHIIIKAVIKILIGRLSAISGEFLHCKSVPPVYDVAFRG